MEYRLELQKLFFELSFSMRKVIFVVLLLLLVAVPLLAGGNARKRTTWKRFKAHLKGNLPPNIRKCLGVKCKPGFSCFYGRCV